MLLCYSSDCRSLFSTSRTTAYSSTTATVRVSSDHFRIVTCGIHTYGHAQHWREWSNRFLSSSVWGNSYYSHKVQRTKSFHFEIKETAFPCTQMETFTYVRRAGYGHVMQNSFLCICLKMIFWIWRGLVSMTRWQVHKKSHPPPSKINRKTVWEKWKNDHIFRFSPERRYVFLVFMLSF